jgi:hypothetical protein
VPSPQASSVPRPFRTQAQSGQRSFLTKINFLLTVVAIERLPIVGHGMGQERFGDFRFFYKPLEYCLGFSIY